MKEKRIGNRIAEDIMLHVILGCLIKRALRRQVLDILAQASCRSLAIAMAATCSGHSQAILRTLVAVVWSEKFRSKFVDEIDR
jgi:hypothetical protein